MCIVCTAQHISRHVSALLSRLGVPLLALWAASHVVLPAAYRLEATTPRLACAAVLLLALLWCEGFFEGISVWRARRAARIREERRARALELQRLYDTATRRCRNCGNPYKDQKPSGGAGGGRFMCTCCGHVSRRPVIDIASAAAAGKAVA